MKKDTKKNGRGGRAGGSGGARKGGSRRRRTATGGRNSGRQPGRPLGFEPEKALDAALRVFWAKGYEGTGLSDLTAAMGINRPSIYATFGNKEELFRKALDRYEAGMTSFSAEALAAAKAREAAERFLNGSADLMTCPENPRGCLMVQGALACGEESEPIRRELSLRRAAGVGLLRERFERAKAEGDLAAGVDAGDLARYVSAVVHGMSVQASGGATRGELQGVIELAMRAWPG